MSLQYATLTHAEIEYLPHYLARAGSQDALHRVLTDYDYFDIKSARGLAGQLADELRTAGRTLSDSEHTARLFQGLGDGVHRNVDFIDSYPNAWFPCLWNACRWRGGAVTPLLTDWRRRYQRTHAGVAWVQVNTPPATGSERADDLILRGHSTSVCMLRFIPDQRAIVSADLGGEVRFWDTGTGRSVRTGRIDLSAVHCHDISPDGRRILASVSSHLFTWNVNGGTLSRNLGSRDHDVRCARFSPDGRLVASGTESGKIRVVDVRGTELQQVRAHKGAVTALAWSTNGALLASGGSDHIVRIWRDNDELASLHGHEGPVTSVDFSPDGLYVASGSWDSTIRVWDSKISTELTCLRGPRGFVRSVAFLGETGHLAVGMDNGTICIWDPGQRRLSSQLHAHDGENPYVCAVGPGRMATASSDGTIRVWNWRHLHGSARRREHSGRIYCGRFSPDGRLLATGGADDTVRLWRVHGGRHIRCLSGHNDSVEALEFDANSTRLVTGSSDRSARVWDVNNGRCVVMQGHHRSVTTVGVVDADRIVTGSDDGTVRLWTAREGRELACMDVKGMVSSVHVHEKEGRVVVGTWEGWICVWDLAKPGRRRWRRGPGGHPGVALAQFSGEGDRVYAVQGGRVRVWDAATGRHIVDLAGHPGGVSTLGVSDDGCRMITANRNEIGIWNLTTLQRTRTIHVDGVYDPAEFLRDARGHPYYVHAKPNETNVTDITSGRAIASMPASGVERVVAHPFRKFWALIGTRRIELIELVASNGT